MKCACVATINEKLKPLNLQLACEAFIMPGFVHTLTLQTEWIDKDKAPKGRKNQPAKINISYCPFCGQLVDYPCSNTSGDTIPVTGVNISEANGSTPAAG